MDSLETITSRQYKSTFPDRFFLDASDPESLRTYLLGQKWILPEEQIVEVERPGDGNMNCTLRVKTTAKSFIMKQSRPWVEKYPHIPAPGDRVLVEAAFYNQIHLLVSKDMPKLIACDEQSRVLIFQDLGEAKDYSDLYSSTTTLNEEECLVLGSYLSNLHGYSYGQKVPDVFENNEMRALNHEHMFVIPLDPNNSLKLDEMTDGLSQLANELQSNEAYVSRVYQLGQLYLAKVGTVLVHGDYYPGSWIRSYDGLRVIDPEFCYWGAPEFDLGVMLAHLIISNHDTDAIAPIFKAYNPAFRTDKVLMMQYAGVELMRRLIGVAQLPLKASLAQKEIWLKKSVSFVLSPNTEEFEF